MKKIISLLLVALMLMVAFMGCSDKTTPNKDVNQGDGTDINADVADNNTEDKDTVDTGDAQVGEIIELPEDFPVAVIPLMDDASIKYVNKNETNKGIGITYSTDKSLSEATQFYKDVMKDGKVISETEFEGSYIIIGEKDNYNITISVSKVTDLTVVLLDTTPK